jgi:endonuclease VIII-like 1
MQELAEVKIMSEYINYVNQKETFIGVEKSKENKNPKIEVPYKRFKVSAKSRGKELMLTITDTITKESKNILMGMGMSGNWLFIEKGPTPKHAHLVFHTDWGGRLCMVDFRRFSRWKESDTWSDNRGPCVLTEWDDFVTNIKSNMGKKEFEKPLYDVMMNQKYFNGLGAYLVAEILGRWNKNPLLPARISIDSDLLLLCNKIPKESYELNGGQLKDWDNPFNEKNNNFKEWLSFYQNKELCERVSTSKKRFIWIKKVFFT